MAEGGACHVSSRAPALTAAAASSGAAAKDGAAAKGGADRVSPRAPAAATVSMGMHMAELAGSPPRAFGTDCTSVKTPDEAPPPSSGKQSLGSASPPLLIETLNDGGLRTPHLELAAVGSNQGRSRESAWHKRRAPRAASVRSCRVRLVESGRCLP